MKIFLDSFVAVGIHQVFFLNIIISSSYANILFYENVNFRGKYKLLILNIKFWKTKIFLYIKGEFLFFSEIKSNRCINLPYEWQNRISSILINKCIVLYTLLDCKLAHKSSPQVFTITENKNKYAIKLSQPDSIPYHNFFGSW